MNSCDRLVYRVFWWIEESKFEQCRSFHSRIGAKHFADELIAKGYNPKTVEWVTA